MKSANELPMISCFPEAIREMNRSARVMLESSAHIFNVIRDVERTCNHASDPVIMSGIHALTTIAGDLAESWAELDMQIAADDLGQII